MKPRSSGRWARGRTVSAGTRALSGMPTTWFSPSSSPAAAAVRPASRRYWADQPMMMYASRPWTPKNTMSASAIRLCHRLCSRTAVWVPREAPGFARTSSHGRAASRANAAHKPSAQRHPSVPTAAAIGAVDTAATVAPTDMAVLYAPTIRPVRPGKYRFTRLGRSTLPRAPPTIASTVPSRKTQKAGATARTTSPAAMVTSAPLSTCESRKRADSPGPAKPMAAKQSTGIVVTSPARPLEMPRPSWISWSTGPTLVTAVRRFSPVSTIAVPMRASPQRRSTTAAGAAGAVRVTGGSSSPRRDGTAPGVVGAGNDPSSALERRRRAPRVGTRAVGGCGYAWAPCSVAAEPSPTGSGPAFVPTSGPDAAPWAPTPTGVIERSRIWLTSRTSTCSAASPFCFLLVSASLSIVMQNGQAVEMTSGSSSRASSVRSMLMRLPIFSSIHMRAPGAAAEAAVLAAVHLLGGEALDGLEDLARGRVDLVVPAEEARVVVGDLAVDRRDRGQPALLHQLAEQLRVVDDLVLPADLRVLPAEGVEAVRAGRDDLAHPRHAALEGGVERLDVLHGQLLED